MQDYYDITYKFIDFLIQEKAKNDGDIIYVALQFPDILLNDATRVVDMPQVALVKFEQVQCKFYILADTSYGSCCVVDAVAAEHVNANCLIHYGAACLSRSYTNKLPVYYVFGKSKTDLTIFKQSLQNKINENNNLDDDKDLIFFDLSYYHLYDQIENIINLIDSNKIILPKLSTTYLPNAKNQSNKTSNIGGFELVLDINNNIPNSHIIFIENKKEKTTRR